MSHRLYQLLFVLFFIAISLIFIALSFNRYYQGQIFYYDFGIFAHIIYQLSRFQLPYINHLALGRIIFLGDHFNPSLVLLAPLFWITSDLRMLLIEQAIATVASGLLVYKIARKTNIPSLAALTISASFLLFAGTENPLVTDWHPEPTAAFSLLAFFYYYVFPPPDTDYTHSPSLMQEFHKIIQHYGAFISYVVFLGFKESNAITMLLLLSWLFFLCKYKRKQIILLALASFSYFLITTRWLIPTLAHHSYLYTPTMPHDPVQIIHNIVNKPEKLKLIHDSFISFGFLPIFSGLGIIPVIGELAIRLAPSATIFNNLTLGQHYNVYLGVFLALGTIYGIKNIQKIADRYIFTRMIPVSPLNKYIPIILATILLIYSLYTARKITGSPINLAINQTFWKQLVPDAQLFNALQQVPPKGSVQSQNNLLAYLSARTDEIAFVAGPGAISDADIIFFDLRDGQNINNYYGSNIDSLRNLSSRITIHEKYRRLHTHNDIYLYVRKQ